MDCEKCGHTILKGENFCEACGYQTPHHDSDLVKKIKRENCEKIEIKSD